MSPHDVLKKYWGYEEFRPNQLEIVQSILNRQDTFALLPTGGGKSICFQVPSVLMSGATIVVSPLISLMKDQVDALIKKGVNATYLASSVSKNDQQRRLDGLKKAKYKIVYVSPERLQSKNFLNAIKLVDISLIVIDEAHCVSVWGHDFRPEYQQIAIFVSQFEERPVVAAFTATATEKTKIDIIKSLDLLNPAVYTASFHRDIAIKILKVRSTTEQELQLFAYLQSHNSEVGIIYVSTRHHAESLSAQLNNLGGLLNIGKVGCYHGGLAADQRQETQQLFLDNKLQLLVATTAFGMGIDKPNIQFVIHYHPSASIENYFQEIGRAGRSGQAAEAVLILYRADFAIQRALIEKSPASDESAKKKLDDFIAFTDSKNCRMVNILKYFNQPSQACEQCDNCKSYFSPIQQLLNAKQRNLQKLVHWRSSMSKHSKIKSRYILQDQQLIYLVLFSITHLKQLKNVPGIGTGWLLYWGKALYQTMIQ